MSGVMALATGLAYVALAATAIFELLRHGRARGFSHFALAFAAMAFTCGPHYLVHAWEHLAGGAHEHAPMTAALLIGAIPGVVFVGLRAEAVAGGRGDRLIRPNRVFAALPWLLAALTGAIVWESLHHAAAVDVDLRALVPNAILAVNYALVAYFSARTQVARRPLLGGWSLSGAAMVGIFASCALSHMVAGLLSTSTPAMLAIDNLAVPASLYFLWAVHRLHRDSLRDWNRRPLVGRASPLGRPSPWSEQGA